MRYAIFLLLLSFLFTHSTCKKRPPCEGVRNLTTSQFKITFVDSTTGNYLYLENPYTSPLNKDSLKIYYDDWTRAPIYFTLETIPGTSSRYYIVEAEPLCFSNYCTIDQLEKTKKFYIQYKYNSFDTLTTIFKTGSDKCGSYFEYMKVFYHGKQIGSISNWVQADFTIKMEY